MKENSNFPEDSKNEEILDLGSEEMPQGDTTNASGDSPNEKEIIDLVDIVEKGKLVQDSESDKTGELFDEETLQSLERVLDHEPEMTISSEETDIDFEFLEQDTVGMTHEKPAEKSKFDLSDFIELQSSEADLEVPTADMAAGLPIEDLSDTPDIPKVESKVELAGITGERIEAIITKVVQDTVERVAREAMATVAEQVIKEAIDALKQSLESSQD
ncbi:MAG: hypothetical protein U9N82_08755 [Thermodesulfobacteriota bacterium]|nr:hypothetical protein [Thermodesulfobacteriota bacterium]